MQLWDLAARNDGEHTGPHVLFSTPEVRGVTVALEQDEELGDHRVRERALAQVLEGRVDCTCGNHTSTCGAGTLIVFEPGETHAIRALEPTRMLLVLAPWPAPGHYAPDEDEDPHELPAHATQPPRES